MPLRLKFTRFILNHIVLAISISFACCGGENNNGDNGDAANNVPPIYPITSFVTSGSTLYTTAYNYGVFRSENAGDTWQRIGRYGVAALAVSDTAVYSANGEIERWEGEMTPGLRLLRRPVRIMGERQA